MVIIVETLMKYQGCQNARQLALQRMTSLVSSLRTRKRGEAAEAEAPPMVAEAIAARRRGRARSLALMLQLSNERGGGKYLWRCTCVLYYY